MFFESTGAVLEVVGIALDEALVDAWRTRALRAAARLGWTAPRTVARPHRNGMSLAIAAPVDQLMLATEVDEWALCASLVERDPGYWAGIEPLLQAAALDAVDGSPPATFIAPVIEERAALDRFERLARLEAQPRLMALLQEARSRGLSYTIDEAEVTVGAGVGGRRFPANALPQPASIRWAEIHDIPTALVTGSNGKTTTVRLLAACARAQGWPTAYNCTDGVFLDTEVLETGDYSGPAGARRVLREPRAHAAILETARGGILRRGIAVSDAAVAVITNLSADHFGEYGIDDLEGLAAVKFAVACVVRADGLLVLNADDPQLRAGAARLAQRFGRVPPLGWFSASDYSDSQPLRACRDSGAATCAPWEGQLRLHHRGVAHDLGSVVAMPLSMKGIATYNIANLAGAALAAAGLGIAPATIAGVLARFGGAPEDNPGRLMQFDYGGVKVIVDYAHNPDGLRGFLDVATALRGTGRLGLLLGQAGNRSDADLHELAAVAARARPDLVVVKENETQLRGRSPGETPRILRAALQRVGVAESALAAAGSEVDAARQALAWAQRGDVLAFPIHSSSARAAVLGMLKAV